MPKKQSKMKNGVVKRGSTFSYTIYDKREKRARWVGGFPTYQAARSAKVAHQKALDEGSHVERRKPQHWTVREFLDQWMESKVGLKPTTRRQYEQCIDKTVTALGSRLIGDLHPEDFDYLRNLWLSAPGRNGKPLSATSVNLYLRTLHGAFKWGVRRGHVSSNPLEHVDRVPQTHDADQGQVVDTFTREEWSRLLDAAEGSMWEPLIYLALATGARRGELMGARFSHFDLDAQVWTVQENATQVGQKRVASSLKGGRSRTILLTDETVAYLRALKADRAARQLAHSRWKGKTDHVIVRGNGELPQPDSATQAVRRLLREAGISHGSLHTGRHSHATELVNSGLPVAFVAARLGHRSTAITEKFYVGDLPASEQAARDATASAIGL